MKPDMYFRTDGSRQIGLGHFVRCISLSISLKPLFNIHFVSKQIPDGIRSELLKYGMNYFSISNEEEFFSRLRNGDYVVIDGYDFNLDYQKKIKSVGCFLTCIDDLHSQKFVADLIINHSPGVSANCYNAQPNTRFALGLDYTLIRPSFMECADIKKKPTDSSILICFGGSDLKNLTLKAYSIVRKLPKFNKIIVITGSGYQFNVELLKTINADRRTTLLESVDEKQMADQMSKADAAIIPASGILYEAIACQTIPVSGMYTDNQKNIYTGFKKLNAFVDSGSFKRYEIEKAMDEIPHFKKQKIIDCKSPERFRQLFKSIISDTN